MPSSRWLWAATVGGLLLVAAVAVPASGLLSGHGPFGFGSGPSSHGPGWASNSSAGRYTVTFSESGLPTGTFWSVSLQPRWSVGTGGNGTPVPLATAVPGWGPGWSHGSMNSTITFSLRNGSYAYSIPATSRGASLFVAAPSSGNLTVNGSAVSVAVAFSALALYNVSFVESGLPSGTTWSVQLSGAPVPGGPGAWGPVPFCTNLTSNSTNTTTVGFLLPNGTYGFSIPNATGPSDLYVPTPASGNVTVSGAAVSVDVAFAAVPLYNVTFVEKGLPTGAFWFVQLSNASVGAYANGSTGTSLSFEVPNGVYNYSVGAPCNFSGIYVPSPAQGTVTVDGANVTVDIAFAAPVLYAVTFAETGLPSGANWSVSVASPWVWPCWGGPGWGFGSFNSSSNATLGFQFPNGTYDFIVSNVSVGELVYVPTPAAGNFTVSGSGLTIDVRFAPVVLYNVSFVESGLPAGSWWSVSVTNATDGISMFNASSGSTVGFELLNGSYNFSVGNASNCTATFAPTPAEGSFTVDGAAVTIEVTFAEVTYYSLNVVETGLPSGTAWFVALAVNGTGWTFGVWTTNATFSVPNGTYEVDLGVAWAAGVPYVPSPAYETVTVNGASVTVDVTYSAA